MSVDEQYAVCPACKVTYRPGVEESRRGHFQALGHWPPDEAVQRPAPPATAETPTVTAAELIQAGARRIAELEAVIAGLDQLATTWEHAEGTHPRAVAFHDAARMLRGYLARPPVHALDEEESDG